MALVYETPLSTVTRAIQQIIKENRVVANLIKAECQALELEPEEMKRHPFVQETDDRLNKALGQALLSISEVLADGSTKQKLNTSLVGDVSVAESLKLAAEAHFMSAESGRPFADETEWNQSLRDRFQYYISARIGDRSQLTGIAREVLSDVHNSFSAHHSQVREQLQADNLPDAEKQRLTRLNNTLDTDLKRLDGVINSPDLDKFALKLLPHVNVEQLLRTHTHNALYDVVEAFREAKLNIHDDLTRSLNKESFANQCLDEFNGVVRQAVEKVGQVDGLLAPDMEKLASYNNYDDEKRISYKQQSLQQQLNHQPSSLNAADFTDPRVQAIYDTGNAMRLLFHYKKEGFPGRYVDTFERIAEAGNQTIDNMINQAHKASVKQALSNVDATPEGLAKVDGLAMAVFKKALYSCENKKSSVRQLFRIETVTGQEKALPGAPRPDVDSNALASGIKQGLTGGPR